MAGGDEVEGEGGEESCDGEAELHGERDAGVGPGEEEGRPGSCMLVLLGGEVCERRGKGQRLRGKRASQPTTSYRDIPLQAGGQDAQLVLYIFGQPPELAQFGGGRGVLHLQHALHQGLRPALDGGGRAAHDGSLGREEAVEEGECEELHGQEAQGAATEEEEQGVEGQGRVE